MAKFFDTIKDYFNIGLKKSANKPSDKIFPTTVDPKSVDKSIKKGEIPSRVREVFPSNVQILFDWWMGATHYNMESWKSFVALLKDCDTMFLNSGIMSRAAEITADETVQVDTGVQSIIVEAKRKQKKFILEFFDKINLYSLIRPIALSIIKYGNAGMVLSYDSSGINEVLLSSVFDLKERLEFSPAEVQKQMMNKNSFVYDYKNKIQRIDQLIDMITNKDNVASYFKKYLFGFVVGDYTLPPWRFLHFRNFLTESPFNPFGTPMFIYSIAPYYQLDAGMTMQVAARGASFPKDVYKITMSPSMPPSEKLSAALEFARELQNSGINAVVKEKDGVGEVIITIADLYEYEQQSADIDLGKMGDLEMLKDDLILSTLLPRYMLDPNDGGFGDSGVALVEKWKPFGRTVYRLQSSILEQINQLVKIQMIYSKEFSLDEIDFVLKMPYPESQTNDDLIRSQNDLLELSNNVIDALKDKFMDGEDIPSEIKTDIYKKFLPYDDKLIDTWVKEIEKAKNAEVDDNGDELDKRAEKIKKDKLNEKWLKIEHRIGRKKLRESIDDTIFDVKQSYLREGSMRGYHYYSSKNTVKDFPAEYLREFDKNKVSNGNDKSKLNEEMKISTRKYKFKGKGI